MSRPVHRDVISIEDDSDEENQEERYSSVSIAESDSDMGPMSRVDEEEQPTRQSTWGATGVRTGHSPRGSRWTRHDTLIVRVNHTSANLGDRLGN
jgi:hypothetical protein